VVVLIAIGCKSKREVFLVTLFTLLPLLLMNR
jgi:hypothetical protein